MCSGGVGPREGGRWGVSTLERMQEGGECRMGAVSGCGESDGDVRQLVGRSVLVDIERKVRSATVIVTDGRLKRAVTRRLARNR